MTHYNLFNCRLLVIWAKFFHEEGDEASFLCIIYPVLLCWAAGPEALGLRPAALTSSTAEDSDRIPRGMVMLTRLQAYCQKHVKESVDYQFVWLDMMQRSFYCLTATLLAFAFGEPVISGKEQALELFESARISLDHLGRNGEAQLLKSTTAQKLTYLGVRGFASSGLSTRTEGIGKISRVRDTDELNKEEKDDDYVGYDEEDDDDEFAIPQKRRMTSESRIQASLNVVGEDDRRLLVALKPTNRLPTETETLFVEAAKTISPAVYNAAIDFVANVFDNTRVNILARCLLSEAEVRGIDSNSFERCFPIRRLYTQYPDSTSLTLLHAHELASRRRYAESFDTHLRAYQLDPTQPQTCLCLGLMLLFFSQHVLVNRKPQVLIKGLAFMDQYRSQRVNVSEHNHNDRVDLANMSLGGDEMTSVSQQAIQQEIYYNFGRFFQEAKLFNLAVDNYNKALEIADTHPRLALTPFSLTREVAFNLILIYKQSGADNMVLNIMSKYLSF